MKRRRYQWPLHSSGERGGMTKRQALERESLEMKRAMLAAIGLLSLKRVRACGGSRRRHDQVRVTVGRGQPDLQQEQPVQARPAGGRRRLGRRHDLACQGQLRRAGVDREGSDPDRGRLRSEHDLRACHRARAGQPRVPEHRRDQ